MDLKDPKELEKLVKFCRKQGITSLKSGDFAIEFASQALFPESTYKKNKELKEEAIQTEPAFTEEDALFWSSAGVGEN